MKIIMRSEAERSFQHGFDLTEQEFRRIIDVLTQQFEKLDPSSPVEARFEIKFRNGVISNPNSLEELFSLENIGSGAIVKVESDLSINVNNSSSTIKLVFVDVDDSSITGSDAITYKITGDDRDWVFITSSQLDERIARVKRFAPNSLLVGGKKRNTRLLLLQLVVLFPLMFSSFFFSTQKKSDSTVQAINELETRWQDGEFDNVPEFLLELERVKLELDPTYNPRVFISDPVLLIPLGLIALLIVLLGIAYVFPFYNFIWGDYVRIYEKRKTLGRIIFGSVVLALIISILANYISSLIGIGS